MSLSITDWETRIGQFKLAIANNFPALLTSADGGTGTETRFNISARPDSVVFFLLDYPVPVQIIYDEINGWFGRVNNVDTYQGVSPLETLQLTFAAAKAAAEAKANKATSDANDLTDVGV